MSKRAGDYLSPRELHRHLKRVAIRTRSRGLDRVSPISFRSRVRQEFPLIRRKALARTYRFTPYREILISKGRGTAPRVISVPTVRDRLCLAAVKEYLHDRYPSAVGTALPNEVVRDIASKRAGLDPATVVLRLDIKSYYDSIPHDKLMAKVRRNARSEALVELVEESIRCPTVREGRGTRNVARGRDGLGVPQGLPSSNILANLYLRDFDSALQRLRGVVGYWRYVDDILLFVEPARLAAVKRSIEGRLRNLGLEVSMEDGHPKYHEGAIFSTYRFLGYQFNDRGLTIPEGKVEGFVDSIARLVTWFRHNEKAIERRSTWLQPGQLRSAFVEDVNERITGAVAGRKRYGWVAYYREVDNVALLHRLDSMIAWQFRRRREFNYRVPGGLKRLVTAYHKIRAGAFDDGYVHNYAAYKSLASKKQYLVDRGILNPKRNHSREAIARMFGLRRQHNLRNLLADEGIIS